MTDPNTENKAPTGAEPTAAETRAEAEVEAIAQADAQADGAETTAPSTTGDSAAGAASVAASGAITADQARIALRRVKDPELNLNIVDLGLVYDVAVEGDVVKVDMSLTSPGCPSGPEIMGEAEKQLRTIPGVGDVVMNLIWTPPWTPERIEPRVRAYMGF
ncbi:MAG: metal-sulfur cluster assembly factor [Gemmatimonas sp.]